MKNNIQKVPRVPQVSQVPWAKKLVAHLVFLIPVILLALPLGKAHAEASSLRLAPSLLKLKAVAPTTLQAPITIENLNDETVELRVELRQFVAKDTQDGQIKYTRGSMPDFFKNVKLLENNEDKKQLTLGPLQKKNLILQFNLSEEAVPSDYYFSVVFVSSKEAQNPPTAAGLYSFTKINSGIGMNVLLSVEKASDPTENKKLEEVVIEEFAALEFIDKGPVFFTVKVQNKGSNYINPKGTIYVTNMFGHLIGKIDLPAQNILANSSRYIGNPSLSSNFSPPKIIWPESFLLGPYEARLEIEAGEDTPLVTKTIRFTALPIKLLLAIIFSIVLGLIIYRRAKIRMSGRR
jgi:hypothetical protein